MLELTVGSDFTLQFYQSRCTAVGVAQHLETDSTDRDQQYHDCEKSDHQLGMNFSWYPRHHPRQEL
jgi:hypothetical protein